MRTKKPKRSWRKDRRAWEAYIAELNATVSARLARKRQGLPEPPPPSPVCALADIGTCEGALSDHPVKVLGQPQAVHLCPRHALVAGFRLATEVQQKHPRQKR